MIPRSARLALLLGLCLATGTAATAAAAAAAAAATIAPQASLTEIEPQVMCVTCGVPLSIAESPQADHERAFIRGLIERGETTAQIKQALVGQLGPGVLALPPRAGFDLAVYLVPLALIAVLTAALALALPRWRRRGDAGAPPPTTELSDIDSARLDEELARYRG